MSPIRIDGWYMTGAHLWSNSMHESFECREFNVYVCEINYENLNLLVLSQY